MSIEIITLLMFGALVVLLLSGLPIGMATGGIAVIFTFFLWGPSSLFVIASQSFKWMNNTVLISVPMFVFMANMLSESGAIDDLFDAVYMWAGPVRGGLAVMTIVASTIMAAMSGIVGATEVTMGLIALPAMLQRKYDKKIALGCIAAGGSLGYLIPPSILTVLFGMASEQSIGKLLIGGIGPGILLALFYIAYVLLRGWLNPDLLPAIPWEERAHITLAQKLGMLRKLILPAILIFLVLGSIYLGIATITESSGLGALGATAIALIHKRLTWKAVKNASILTIRVSSMITWLVIGSSAFISVYTALGGTEFARNVIMSLPLGRWGILISMQIFLIFLGCFIDWAGILTLTTPIFLPVLIALKFDPIWYGILFNINMQISCLSPPFGPALFYLRGIVPPGITMGDIYKSALPFIVIQMLVLALTMIFPPIAMYLPSLVK